MIDPTPPARPPRPPRWHAVAFVVVGALAGGGVAYAAGPRRAATSAPAPPTTTTRAATTTAATVAPSTTSTSAATTTTTSTTPATTSAPTTTTVAPAPELPTVPGTTVAPTSTTLPSTPAAAGARADQDHPCDALTAAEVAAAMLTTELSVVAAPPRCRYVTAARTDRAVVSIAQYPSADVARNGLRDTRRGLAETERSTCDRADAGDEALVCRPTLGPVAVVGLVRVGASVLRVDLFGSPPAGGAALLLGRAATRL